MKKTTTTASKKTTTQAAKPKKAATKKTTTVKKETVAKKTTAKTTYKPVKMNIQVQYSCQTYIKADSSSYGHRYSFEALPCRVRMQAHRLLP